MTDSLETNDRAASAAARQAHAEQHSADSPDTTSERSLNDVLHDPAVLTAAGVMAPYVIDAIKKVVKQPPGEHETPPHAEE